MADSKNREKNRIISNFFSLTILQAANYILPLIILPFLVRVLDLENFGIVMFSQALITFIVVAVDFGFDISGTREISVSNNDKERISEVFSAIVTIRVLLIFLWFIILILLVECIPKLKANAFIYYLNFGVVVGQGIFPAWFFQGIQRMKFVTFVNILAKLIFTLLILFIVNEKEDYYLVPAFNSIGFLIAGLFGFFLAFKHIYVKKPNFNLIKTLLRDSVSLFFGKLANNIFTSCNILILGFFAGNTIVGIYSSFEKLILAIKNIYIPFFQSTFPWLANKTEKEKRVFIKKISPYIFSTGVAICLLILFFGDRVLMLVFDNSSLSQYSNLFKIFSVVGIFAGLSMIFTMLYLPAVKKYTIRMKIFISAAVFHLLVAIVLTRFYQIYGVVFSVILTELLLLLLGYYYYKRESAFAEDNFLPKS